MNKNGADRYQVRGDLTFATVDAWLTLPEKWSPGTGPITIDLAEVSKTDSAALALMIEWQRRARALRRPLIFKNTPAKLQDLIRVSGLSALFSAQKAA